MLLNHEKSPMVVLVPLFKESEWLLSGFQAQWNVFFEKLPEYMQLQTHLMKTEICFCVWSSTEEERVQDCLVLNNVLGKLNFGKYFSEVHIESFAGKNPSVASSLRLGVQKIKNSKFVLINPADCLLSLNGWLDCMNFVLTNYSAENNSWAVFQKKYSPSGFIKISEVLQNNLFVRYLKQNCWTNLFLFPAQSFESCVQISGFLEDLDTNKRLRNLFGPPQHLNGRVIVSSRRYEKRGQILQMLRNVRIFLAYVFLEKNSKKVDFRASMKELHNGKGE